MAVANRLPVTDGDEGWELSPGGLVTALRPVMATHSGAWVGWDGGAKGVPSKLPDLAVPLAPISLSATQIRRYYHGFANATLWPLLHDAIEKPRFERAWWQSYQQVNAAFADSALTALGEQPDPLAWVHDYHLMLVPRLIRDRRRDQPIGFFLHVPWPSPDIFARLPWRQEILLGLLLQRRADLRAKLAFLQIAVPSRDNVREYRNLRATVERHIGRINGQFTEPGSDVPIHYLYRKLPPQQLAAYYAAATTLLVTPLIDGMNLIAKEYVTVQQARRGNGSLVLSEFTGAAAELGEAIPCNPFDVEGLSQRIQHALQLPADTRHTALAAMARHIRSHDVHTWATQQLADIASRGTRR